MDSRWFEEDRKLPKSEQKIAQEQSEKALKNSTLLTRRLTKILEDQIEKTYLQEEDFSDPAYNLKVIASASERKALKGIIKLLP